MTRRRPGRANADADPDDRALETLLADLTSTLEATAELPVAPAASVWLGEAHAVAADLTGGVGDLPDERVIHERVGHVHRLLTSAGDVENEVVAGHVDDAVSLTERILARTDDEASDEASA